MKENKSERSRGGSSDGRGRARQHAGLGLALRRSPEAAAPLGGFGRDLHAAVVGPQLQQAPVSRLLEHLEEPDAGKAWGALQPWWLSSLQLQFWSPDTLTHLRPYLLCPGTCIPLPARIRPIPPLSRHFISSHFYGFLFCGVWCDLLYFLNKRKCLYLKWCHS